MGHLTERELDILAILKKEPMISQEDLATRLNISRSAAAVHISNLIKKGAILGRGYVFNERTGIVIIGGSYLVVRGKKEKEIDVGKNQGKIEIGIGGAALNLAECLSWLKMPTLFLTALGRDESGDLLIQRLQTLGINTNHILRSANHPTGKLIEIVDENGSPIMTVADREVDILFTSAWMESKWPAIQKADYIAVDTELPNECISYLLETASQGGLRVCVNTLGTEDKRVALRPHLSKISVLMTQSQEAEELINIPVKDEEQAIKAAKEIVKAGVEAVVVLIDNQGAILATREEAILLPVLSGRLISETVGREVIAAGMLYGLAHGYSYRQAARIGLGAAHVAYKARDGWDTGVGVSALGASAVKNGII